MKMYRYRQNNSGGSFTKPAIAVYIEADSPEEADLIAERNGIYFDDECEIDCECCGSRWGRASEYNATEEVDEHDKTSYFADEEVPAFVIIEKVKANANE